MGKFSIPQAISTFVTVRSISACSELNTDAVNSRLLFRFKWSRTSCLCSNLDSPATRRCIRMLRSCMAEELLCRVCMRGREYFPSSRSSQKPFALVYCDRGQRCQLAVPCRRRRNRVGANGSHLLIRGSDSRRGFGSIGLRGSVGRPNPFQGLPSSGPA